jgi:hypothetical protein
VVIGWDALRSQISICRVIEFRISRLDAWPFRRSVAVSVKIWMMRREGFKGRLLEFSLQVHKMVDKVPGAQEGDGDPVATQLVVSSMMIGPKYAGIVPGLDRGHTLARLELCCGNADEAVYWLEHVQTYWPQLASEAKKLHAEAVEIAGILHERMDSFARPKE